MDTRQAEDTVKHIAAAILHLELLGSWDGVVPGFGGFHYLGIPNSTQ
jgi:hypothetical protein